MERKQLFKIAADIVSKYQYDFKPLIDLKEKGIALNQSIRSKINKELQKISTTKGNYYKAIPLQDIFDVLENSAGIIPIQEDGAKWDGFLTGRDAQIHFDLVIEDIGGKYKLIDNCQLNLSWYKMESGNYEINVFLM